MTGFSAAQMVQHCWGIAELLYIHSKRTRRHDTVLRRLLEDFPEFSEKLGIDVTKPQCVSPPA